MIAFNEAHAAEEMPYFRQELHEQSQAKGPLTDQAYLDVLAKNFRLSRDEGLDAVMTEHNLDALIAPTSQPAATIDQVNGDRRLGGCSTPAALAGYPLISMPCGLHAVRAAGQPDADGPGLERADADPPCLRPGAGAAAPPPADLPPDPVPPMERLPIA